MENVIMMVDNAGDVH